MFIFDVRVQGWVTKIIFPAAADVVPTSVVLFGSSFVLLKECIDFRLSIWV